VFSFLATGSMVIGNLNAAHWQYCDFLGRRVGEKSTHSAVVRRQTPSRGSPSLRRRAVEKLDRRSGNSGGPPASVPSYMGVIASSTIVKSGSNIVGDGPIIIVVKTNPVMGHRQVTAGTGTVVAIFCH